MGLMKKKSGAAGTETEQERPKKKKKWKKRRVILPVLLLAAAAGCAWGARALFFSGEEQTALTETTTYGSLTSAIEGTATTMPASSVAITTASTAEVLEVYVSAGDTVEEGDLLYLQDDGELDDQIEAYREQIAELEEELESSCQQLEELQETLEALAVRAPFAGRLTEVSAGEGDSVQKGGRLAVLVDDSEMTLTEYFSYAYEDQVYVGMAAGVSAAELMKTFDGTVTAIRKVERLTTEGDRCFAVTITLENPGALTEGMTGAAYLLAEGGGRLYPAVEGTLEYARRETLTAGASGELTAVNAAAYQKVSGGETLFVVDGSGYESQAASINKKITQTGEKIAACQERIAETEEKRGDYAVTAPLSGKVISVGVREGEKPRQAGMTEVSIYNLDTMTITANIDELDIDSIEKGMGVTVTRSGSERDSHYQGTVTEVSYEATNSSGVAYFPITIEIPAGGELAAGVNVSYAITTGDAEEGVLAPVAALKSTTEGTCLFVKSDTRPDHAVDLDEGVVPDGFWAVPVEVGLTNSRYARILSGVEQDTEVFTRYQNAAPSNSGATSQGQGGEEEFTLPEGGFGGQAPGFDGGGRGGSMGGMGGGPMGQ